MKKNWWKLLAVGLVLYSIVGGLLIPLGPGIQDVYPSIFQPTDRLTVSITGYNSHYQSAESSLKIWLQNGALDLSDEGRFICGERVTVSDEHHVQVEFSLPAGLPSRNFHLLINNAVDGTTVLQSALNGQGPEGDPVQGSLCAFEAHPESLGHIYFPHRELLVETIRNLYFHVPMWWSMIILLLVSLIFSIRFLSGFRPEDDVKAAGFAHAAMLLGVLGLTTGMIWAQYTWGAWWVSDARLNGAAITMLIYLAYMVLRNSMDEPHKRAQVAAVYNIFAYVMLIVLLLVLPRMTDSLHPGYGGNPAFSQYDLDSTMRLVFYPAMVGWILMGVWFAQLKVRSTLLEHRLNERE